MDINPRVFLNMAGLPGHEALCAEILLFFRQQPPVIGAFVSGSAATGGMDEYSDLDLGFICENKEAKEKVWRQRFNWKMPPFYHRMDADHIKSHFVIYLFEPNIHVDFSFYTREDLPHQSAGPIILAWDRKGLLGGWNRYVNEPYKTPPDWAGVVHEEERFWTWTHYCWMHTGRGEYYDAASFFPDIRGLLEKWHARLGGSELFRPRRIEMRTGERGFLDEMSFLFPTPTRESLKTAMGAAIAIADRNRVEIEKAVPGVCWKTTPAAREKITALVSAL